MNIKTITFSPTGGTKAVADILARTLDPDPFDIDLTDRFADHEQVALAADDLVVIAMPCFCGRVPVLAAERFAHIRGNGARAVIVAVYGNRDFDDELVELADPDRCISCMRCIAICPVGARAIDPAKQQGIAEHLRAICSVRKEPALYL